MKKLLILDLDETLIHATKLPLNIKEDFLFEEYYVYCRPYLHKFLTEISQSFKLGIWSSAGDEYVQEIVAKIKPNSLNFEFVWARSKCNLKRDKTYDEYYFEKRLSNVEKLGFDLSQVLIVDDSPEKVQKNYGNAIYIKSFTGNEQDEELLNLSRYLQTLKTVENVRRIEKRNWDKF